MTDTTIGLYDSNGDAIIEYDQFDATGIKYLYVATGWGSTGRWIVNVQEDGFDYIRDPAVGLDKAVARLGKFMEDNLSDHSGFVISVNGKVANLASRMMAKYEKLLNKKCTWSSSADEEEDDGLRYHTL